MLIQYSDGRPFATGATRFFYEPASILETLPRILITIEIEGFSTLAVVDTAAPYVVCVPEIAKAIGLDPSDALGPIGLFVRGRPRIDGHLYRLGVTFKADYGMDVQVDATVFVPSGESEALWGELPSFIGLTGCLERVRFAIDPDENTFYFGEL